MNWSRDARPTGPEDECAILKAIGSAMDSVWNSIRIATERIGNESEDEWKRRRNEAYRQLAPLLDRVSRLSGDASSLLTFMGEGNHIPEGPPIQSPSLSLPPSPSREQRQDPYEGMENRIRSGLNEGDVVLVLNGNEPQTIVVPIDENGIQNQVVQSLQQLFSQISETTSESPPLTDVLSESIQAQPTTDMSSSLL